MTEPRIRRETLANGLRLVTETMPHVRSVSIGVWLTRGSRHEPADQAGIAHFVEHMLFKGTDRRTAEDIAQEVDSIGGQLDAFTSKEYAGYYVKVLDQHLPRALDVLADLVTAPTFAEEEIAREKKVVLEEIKMVEDTPDDLVHEIFAERFWHGHALGRPILGLPDSVRAFDRAALARYFRDAYVAGNFVVVAVGHLEHDAVRALVEAAFRDVPPSGSPVAVDPPAPTPGIDIRRKDLEQSHVCFGTAGLPQRDPDRYAGFVLNTVLGGSMSSRLFQNVREKRGLAYAVFSGMSAYRDAGALSVYAGCGNDAVAELIDVVVAEIRRLRDEPLPADELRRAQDHLKGSLILSLEGTSSRMSHLARQEIYQESAETLDDMLAAIDRVTADDVGGLGRRLFGAGSLGVTVLGDVNGLRLTPDTVTV
ncbi:MAG: M16 family metallopeptidase [Vicinamibacterales bacterium]